MRLNISAAEAGSNKSCSQFLGRQQGRSSNIRALISRIGFWGPLYSKYNEKPPQISPGHDGAAHGGSYALLW